MAAFAKDTGPAAEAVKEFLESPSQEAAENLIKALPGLMPKEPDMASIIADAMAEAMAEAPRNHRPRVRCKTPTNLRRKNQDCEKEARLLQGYCRNHASRWIVLPNAADERRIAFPCAGSRRINCETREKYSLTTSRKRVPTEK